MIRNNLLKATLITKIIATLLTTTACGKKSANNNQATETKATVKSGYKFVNWTDNNTNKIQYCI